MSDRIPPYFWDREDEEVSHTDVWPICEDCGEALSVHCNGTWFCLTCSQANKQEQ